MSDQSLVNTSALRECLGLTWYLMKRYQRLGIVPKADGYVRGRPVWKITRIEEAQQAIDRYERQISEAKYSPV